MDPLEYLDNDCVSILLSSLSSVELVQCELVGRSWRNCLQQWMVNPGIRLHFPYVWAAQNRGELTHARFKQLAFQERAVQLGEPTSVRRFPNAHHFTVAGDFATWAVDKGDSINWQLLAHAGPDEMVCRTNELDLRDVGEGNQRIALLDMDLNPDGYLLLRLQLGPSIYTYWDSSSPVQCRDVVYSLTNGDIVWFMDEAKETSRLTPLLIGKQRVYFASRTESNGYDLVAYELQSGRLLYRTPVIANIADRDRGYLARNRRKVLQLTQHCEDELIIQFNSDRLVSSSWDRRPIHFSIINGANGQIVQKIGWGGFRGYPIIAKSNSTALALASSVSRLTSPNCFYYVIIQTFSQQADQSFLRTAVRMVTLATGPPYIGSVIVHPFTFQAFSTLDGDLAPRTLTLSPDQSIEQQIPPDFPELKVDEYHRVTAARPLTLPPRQSNGGRNGRRKFNVRAEWNCARLALLDERRIVFDHIGTKDDAVYLFDFTPKW